MVNFPLKFEMQAKAGPKIHEKWEAFSDGLKPIECAIPLEFMGPGGGYSPEDLFGLSILNCLIATFKVYAEKGGVVFQEINGKVQLSMDKQAGQSGLALTSADIFLNVLGAESPEQAKKTLERAIRDCAVSNSIKTAKTFHLNVSPTV